MKLQDALKKSAKIWYEGKTFENFTKASPTKYTLEYFDRLEEELGIKGKKKKEEEID